MEKESISSELSERKTERMLLQSRIADMCQTSKFAATRDELMAARKKLEDVKNKKMSLSAMRTGSLIPSGENRRNCGKSKTR